MRYLVRLTCVLAGLLASPLSVSAQAGEEGATSEPHLQEPSSGPAPKEPALELKLDDAGVEVVPGYPPRFDELALRVKRARIGLGSSGISLGAGCLILVFGAAVGLHDPSSPAVDPLLITGSVLAVGGFVAMIATGVVLGKRKRKLNRLKDEYYRTRRGAQWDLERSRLVF